MGKLRVPTFDNPTFESSSVPSRKRCSSSVGTQPFPPRIPGRSGVRQEKRGYSEGKRHDRDAL